MAGVNYIELGYRTKNNSGYFGPLAYTTEDFIEILNSKVYENTNIICFSNGSFDGIKSKIIENL